MRKRASLSKESGFTLVEVVVAMTLLGLILLMISGAFRLGLSAWDRGERTQEEFQRQRAAAQLISRQMKSMVPYKVKTQKAEGDYLAFVGRARSLKFISTLSLKTVQPNGLIFAVYEYQDGGYEGGQLVAYERRVVNKDFFEESPKEDQAVVLLERLSGVSFEYYREEDPEKNRSAGWFDDWNAKDEKELPRAIRMTLTYKNDRREKEEVSFTQLSSIYANRYEDVKTVVGSRLRPPGFPRRSGR